MTEKTNSTEMAKDRTDWAEDRTILANERTFAGWMRTGMACIALALGLRALFGEFEPTWAPKLVANLFILIGVVIFWLARNKSCQTTRRMEEHDTESQSTAGMTFIAATLSAGGVLTAVILWYL